MWAAIVGFIKALPELIIIYNSIRKLVGGIQYEIFIGGLSELTKKAVELQNTNLPEEQKRIKRRELLAQSRATWDRALGT